MYNIDTFSDDVKGQMYDNISQNWYWLMEPNHHHVVTKQRFAMSAAYRTHFSFHHQPCIADAPSCCIRIHLPIMGHHILKFTISPNVGSVEMISLPGCWGNHSSKCFLLAYKHTNIIIVAQECKSSPNVWPQSHCGKMAYKDYTSHKDVRNGVQEC